MRFVRIPAGTFVMGSPMSEAGRRNDETQHRVVISRSFYMSATEVTQAQWKTVMGSSPSFFRDGVPELPVERVTWYDVQAFLQRLSAHGGGHFRLPTEAEWEYACRAGTSTEYAFGGRLSTEAANYNGHRPMRVASYRANRWGLYDMHGNVWEWCADEYCPYPDHQVRDPVNRCGSRYKVIRGGSWYFDAGSARSALRYTHEPQWRGFSIGFRVVRDDPGR
jgi:formylglycine-generating enzyme required for sulfatase activity